MDIVEKIDNILNEQKDNITVYFGFILGGRGGTSYHLETFNINKDTNEDELEDITDEIRYGFLLNDFGDESKLLKAFLKGKMEIFDHEEGTAGFTINKSDLNKMKKEIQARYLDSEEGW